ncbi:hypothetical protein ACF07V_19140 [Streptomyces sp. NPDC015661]|uniref:hypothetical protein n=1 Tax=Streptomyces sp. NPDC015661 TaxID=3364961 RepID=UPI0036FA8354
MEITATLPDGEVSTGRIATAYGYELDGLGAPPVTGLRLRADGDAYTLALDGIGGEAKSSPGA